MECSWNPAGHFRGGIYQEGLLDAPLTPLVHGTQATANANMHDATGAMQLAQELNRTNKRRG
jgi:hypothetical protein